VTSEPQDSFRPFYADWAGYNRRAVEGLRILSPDDLTLRIPSSDHWPASVREG